MNKTFKTIFKNLFFTIIIISIISFIIYFIFFKENDTSQLNKIKVEQEVSGIEGKIINLLNELNNYYFSSNFEKENNDSKGLDEENSINWKWIKEESEDLYFSWINTISDLQVENVKNDDILNFSNLIDELFISIKKEDKIRTSAVLANMYSYIPKYEKYFSNDENKVAISQIKSYVLNSYAYCEQDNWVIMNQHLNLANEILVDMINKPDTNSNYYSKLGNIYILLNEVINCLDKQDKDLFLIKYSSLIDHLNEV